MIRTLPKRHSIGARPLARTQRGQALIWLVGIMAAAVAVLYGIYDVTQVTSGKQKAVNAADSAALAGATVEARLLNLMASLRIRPNKGAPLIRMVRDVFMVANDRLYAKVDRKLLDSLQTLANDPKRPFYAEGTPHASIHGRLLAEMPEPPEVKSSFKNLLSFRAEGAPSMQVVIAVPPADSPHTYADFDLDLGNPLQDVAGFFVHMGELLDGKPTNHLDLRKRLAKTTSAEFLYYTIE